MSGPLRGLRVIDLTQYLAGPFCSMMLADLGAEVVKVEQPDGGDSARRFGPPFLHGESAAFLTLNRNKLSVTLNLRQEEGRAILRRLIEDADVVLENYRPGVAARLGLDYETLKRARPGLVYCSISGFGERSPYANRPGLDLIAQGMSGIMSVTGEPDRPPVKVGVPITDLGAGLLACIGVLAALQHRHHTGEGQWVETSLLDAGLALSVWEASGYLASGARPEPMGSAHRLVAPYQAFPTRDGHVTLGAANQAQWVRLCKALGLGALIDDPRFADNPARMRNRSALVDAIAERTQTFASAELVAALDGAGIASGPILGYDAILNDTHVREREMVVPQVHPVAGEVRVLGVPIKFAATPGEVRRPAPRLGEHTAEVLRRAGYDDAAIAGLVARGVCGPMPAMTPRA
jgi:crotonobetainyl-CoA:carnitine CoA-transferase CaiB-like acyl-CoA transferase